MRFKLVRNLWVSAPGLLSLFLVSAPARATTPQTSAEELQIQTISPTATAILPSTEGKSNLVLRSGAQTSMIYPDAVIPVAARSLSGQTIAIDQGKDYTKPAKPTAKPAPYTKPDSYAEPTKPVATPTYPDNTTLGGSITSVSQLSDVRPTDWAFQALQSLVERYGCIVGYPDRTFRGNRALSRYEFAAGLNACLDRVSELIAASTANAVRKEDLAVLQRLQEEFAAELATLRGRVDSLEARTATLEKQQFSTTTKLVGEAIFSISDIFGNQVGGFNNTVFQDRVRLGLQTSFTGKDVLNTRLAAGNFNQFFVVGDSLSPFVLNEDGQPLGSVEGTLTPRINGQTGNRVVIDRLDYTFPVGDRFKFYVAGAGGKSQYYVHSTVNPFLEDFDGGRGSISAFGQESPIYRIGGGAGAAFSFAFDKQEKFVLSGGYLASNATIPSGSNGLFNGDFAALGQLTITPSNAFQLGLTYVHGYHTSGNAIFNLGLGNNSFFTGTLPANAIHTAFDRAAVTNSYGIEASFKLSPKVVINSFGGFTDLNLIGSGGGEIWYYGVGLAFPDLFKKGNLGGIVVGVEPYLGSVSTDGFSLKDLGLKNDTSLHVEGFYRFQLTDNIAITPGVVWITAPDQNNDNDDYVILTLRTTFSF